ncbi:MAG: PEP-CTERM motif protein [Candidatus Scalindua rubra]|uniref:PEP-CTERM motif protein n=1 Tax=Candidatus Scalindua rubra TaxID=1872076 RepID=A0A1E3X822_9BACT|nr:MAG: PEP-CTERM motif protein [Candidatus Scalindua rubra]
MRLQKIAVFLLMGILLLMLSSPVNALVIKNLEFNVDGVLPSTEPDIELFNNTGQPETLLYSVSGGLLMQRTFNVNGNASYNWPEDTLTPGTLNSAMDISMEARLQVLQIEGSAGAFFQAFDGNNRYSAFFQSTGVDLPTTTGSVTIPVNVLQFHTYRLESPGNSNALNFFIDDVLKFSGSAPAQNVNGFNWGDGVTGAGNGADADWDFVRVSQTSPIPEPTTISLLGIGLFGFGANYLRRARKRFQITALRRQRTHKV